MGRNLVRMIPRGIAVVLLLGTAHLVGRGQFASTAPAPVGGGSLGVLVHESHAAPRVHYRERVTGPAAETHRLLNKVIEFPFQNEHPLQDFLEYLRQQTVEDAHPKGLAIYVDPISLLEVDRTLQSPITLQLDAATVGRGLELVLRQIDLIYTVEPDGLLIIDSVDEDPWTHDPLPYLLDEMRALRHEVEDLRLELRANGLKSMEEKIE